MPFNFHFDNATLALLSVCALLAAVTYKLAAPPPLVHPFILGRQAIPRPTRLPGQSPVYTNASNGGARPQYRPDKDTKSLHDILKRSHSVLEGTSALDLGAIARLAPGQKLVQLVQHLRAGLVTKIGGKAAEGRVIVAIQDPTDALLVTLALACSPYKPFVLAPGSVLEDAAPADLVAVVRSPNWAPWSAGVPDIVIDDEADDITRELIEDGKLLFEDGKDGAAPPGEASDVVLSMYSDGRVLEYTNQNLTASLVSWASLFPTSPTPTKPTIKDSVLSFHHPSTPYGFGLALHLISQSAGLAFPTLPQAGDTPADQLAEIFKAPSRPGVTLMFAPVDQLAKPLYNLILSEMLGDSSFIVRASRDGKLRLLREGIVTKQTFWDSLLYKGLRQDTNLTRLRALFLAAPPAFDQSRLETLRGALGCPVAQTLSHPALLAPLCAGHMFDLQRLPPPGMKRLRGDEKSHVGPPALGMEIKIDGKEEEIAAGRIKGEILVRTPVLPNPKTLSSDLLITDISRPAHPPYPGTDDPNAQVQGPQWFKTGVLAEISPEGTIWIDESASRALV